MKIDIMNDVVPPVAVTAINIAAGKSTNTFLGQPLQQVLNYAMAGGGYLSYMMNWGGRYSEFLKNLGIAAAPAALLAIYNKFATTPSTIQRRSAGIPLSRVSRYPAPASESPFQGTRLV